MKQSDVGKLDKRIDLLEPVGAGMYKVVATVWAIFRRPSIKSGAMLGSAEAVVITQGVTIRERKDVRKGWRIRYPAGDKRGELYDVLHVDASVRHELTLTCKDIEVQT